MHFTHCSCYDVLDWCNDVLLFLAMCGRSEVN
jgi:hypothetical protein